WYFPLLADRADVVRNLPADHLLATSRPEGASDPAPPTSLLDVPEEDAPLAPGPAGPHAEAADRAAVLGDHDPAAPLRRRAARRSAARSPAAGRSSCCGPCNPPTPTSCAPRCRLPSGSGSNGSSTTKSTPSRRGSATTSGRSSAGCSTTPGSGRRTCPSGWRG